MKICARCGQKLDDNETFCNRCGGTNFKIPQPRQQVNIQKQPLPQQSVQQQAPQQQQNIQRQNTYQQSSQQNVMGNVTHNGMRQSFTDKQMEQKKINLQQDLDKSTSGGAFGIFKSRKVKQAEMEAEMARMKQMQQEKQIQNLQNAAAQAKLDEERAKLEFERAQMQQQQQQILQQQQIVRPGQKSNPFTNSNNQFTEAEPDMSIKDWVIMLVMLAIPGYNIFYVIANMNNPKFPPYKQNYLKAYGLYFVASFVISLIISIIITVSTT